MPVVTQGKNISSSAQINPGTIEGSDIANDAIDSQHYAADSIDNEHYAPGSIGNTEIDANAAIADSKLAQITTAEKVSGAALTSLASIPAGAGVIPSANLPGANGYERLAETVLGADAATISLTSLSARKHLIIEIHVVGRSVDNNLDLRFNNDSGNNYCKRESENGAADTTVTSASLITFGSTGTGQNAYITLFVTNKAANEKLIHGYMTHFVTAGAGTAPTRREIYAKWVNTADQITRVDIFQSSGNILAGGRLTVYGSAD